MFQGMLYSPVKFTGAPDAQCLQGMRYPPVKFTGAPEAQCLQGMGTRCPMFAGDAVRGGEDQVYIYSLLGIITVCINVIQ